MEHSYLEIKGGLGNQLFQYFFAQALYKYTKKKIYYDISFFENSTIDTSLTTRSFLLNEFTTKIRIAPNNDIIAFRRLLDFPLPKPKVLKLLRNRIYVENKFYTPNIFFLSKYFCYYSGYFQTFKYFDFQSNLNIKLKCENKNFLYWKTLIESGNSVGIHMRRGDYANSVNKKIFIQQPQEYFFRALELIKSKNKVKFIYIFTDDINFCKKVNISANAIIVSEDPSISTSEELMLLSLTQHKILSNSTFSIWSTLLSDSGGYTIFPKNWFHDKSLNSRRKLTLSRPHWIEI